VTPVVVLAFAFVVMALGATFVAGLQLRQAVSRLARSARADVDRLWSLADELQQGHRGDHG
jgi:hypothetical protein